jgi:hypothetical protein
MYSFVGENEVEYAAITYKNEILAQKFYFSLKITTRYKKNILLK